MLGVEFIIYSEGYFSWILVFRDFVVLRENYFWFFGFGGSEGGDILVRVEIIFIVIKVVKKKLSSLIVWV